jgi:hypothetical protein
VIVDADATVLAWIHGTDPERVSNALHAVQAGDRPSSEASGFRPPSPRAAVGALLKGGFKAVWDFARIPPLGAVPAPGRRRLLAMARTPNKAVVQLIHQATVELLGPWATTQ